MAIASKVNGDLQLVSVSDSSSPVYTNPISATFSGYIATATTVEISNVNGTINAGDIIGGAYLPQGTITSAPVGYPAVITLTLPTSESINPAAIGLTVPMATAPATSLYTAGKAVQTGSATVDYYTLTIEANKHLDVIEVIQKLALIQVYQINNPITLAVGFCPSSVWGSNATEVRDNLRAACPAGLGTIWIVNCVDGATLNN